MEPMVSIQRRVSGTRQRIPSRSAGLATGVGVYMLRTPCHQLTERMSRPAFSRNSPLNSPNTLEVTIFFISARSAARYGAVTMASPGT